MSSDRPDWSCKLGIKDKVPIKIYGLGVNAGSQLVVGFLLKKSSYERSHL